jgi:hypothetical protein
MLGNADSKQLRHFFRGEPKGLILESDLDPHGPSGVV